MVTYILGAGASAHAIPVVNKIAKGVEELIGKLQNTESYPYEFSHPKMQIGAQTTGLECHSVALSPKVIFEKTIKPITNHLEEFKLLAENYQTVDSYAKMLHYMQEDADLKRLKNLLTLWLVVQQVMSNRDIRYDSFFGNFLKERYQGFPSNLNIVTWNYDLQIELGLKNFVGQSHRFIEVMENFGLISRSSSIQCPDSFESNARPAIIKLNGTCAFGQPRGHMTTEYFVEEIAVGRRIIALQKALESFEMCSTGKRRSEISFAWEASSYFNETLNLVEGRINQSTSIVIIGYSFPYYNRKTDLQLLSSSANGGQSKIFIQDLRPEGIKEKLVDEFGFSPERIKCLSPDNLGEFYIPMEFFN